MILHLILVLPSFQIELTSTADQNLLKPCKMAFWWDVCTLHLTCSWIFLLFFLPFNTTCSYMMRRVRSESRTCSIKLAPLFPCLHTTQHGWLWFLPQLPFRPLLSSLHVSIGCWLISSQMVHGVSIIKIHPWLRMPCHQLWHVFLLLSSGVLVNYRSPRVIYVLDFSIQVLVLSTWNYNFQSWIAGMEFIASKSAFVSDNTLLNPVGFNIIFPAMIEQARFLNLNIPLRKEDLDALLHRRNLELAT